MIMNSIEKKTYKYDRYCINCNKLIVSHNSRNSKCYQCNNFNKTTKYNKDLISKWCEEYSSGLKIYEISNKYNIKEGIVYSAIKRNGIKRKTNQKYIFNRSFFEKIDTEEKAYWLGFISADGAINNRHTLLSLNLKYSDIGHIKKFLKSIEMNEKKSVPITILDQRKYGRNSIVASLALSSTEIVKDLINIGVGPKKTYTLKPWQSSNDALERHYWRGIIDGDGCLYKPTPNSNLIYCSLVGNLEVLQGFNDFLKKQLNFSVLITPHGTIYKMFVCKQSIDLFNTIYKDSNIFLERKMKIAMMAINNNKNKYGK